MATETSAKFTVTELREQIIENATILYPAKPLEGPQRTIRYAKYRVLLTCRSQLYMQKTMRKYFMGQLFQEIEVHPRDQPKPQVKHDELLRGDYALDFYGAMENMLEALAKEAALRQAEDSKNPLGERYV